MYLPQLRLIYNVLHLLILSSVLVLQVRLTFYSVLTSVSYPTISQLDPLKHLRRPTMEDPSSESNLVRNVRTIKEIHWLEHSSLPNDQIMQLWTAKISELSSLLGPDAPGTERGHFFSEPLQASATSQVTPNMGRSLSVWTREPLLWPPRTDVGLEHPREPCDGSV